MAVYGGDLAAGRQMCHARATSGDRSVLRRGHGFKGSAI
ncbi:uncharacterized protein G2W53_018903 [Senna tora]|uniref:Uncharacterized protein n=1 Tax=Senna tora TaxID=362788 RepID=A0A834TTX1_9FABA|nr:uncharacterized protein G2W53_018903 [Senna tora]